MKKRVVALALAAVLTLSMSMTAFADSSNTSNNSGNQEETTTSAPAKSNVATPSNPKPVDTVVKQTKAGAAIKPAAVRLAVPSADGSVKAVTLDKVVAEKQAVVKTTVAQLAAVSGQDDAVAVQMSAILTTAPTEFFAKTVVALSEMKGSEMVVNNMATVKTAAVAQDAFGNNIASAGVVKDVTSGALVMLMSVNADGTIEYVEGVVDPVTGAVVGAFKGVPAIITVLVLA